MVPHRKGDVKFAAERSLPWLAAGLVLCTLVRLGAWLAAGPTEYLDTWSYVAPAQTMARTTIWLSSGDPEGGPGHALLFRMAGYPLAIATAERLAGAAWQHLIVAVQITLSLAAGVALFRLATACGLGPAGGLLVMLVHGLALTPMYDIAILTDSPFASLLVLGMAIPARAAAEGRELAQGAALASGLLFAAAFLMREALEILLLALAPLLAILVARSRSKGRALVAALLVLAPTLAAGQLYRAWNGYRAGLPILTSSQSGAYLLGIVDAARYDRSVLDGLGVYSPVLQQEVKTYSFDDIVRAREILEDSRGLSQNELSQHARDAYWLTWRRHPEDMVRAAAGRLLAFDEVGEPLARFLETQEGRELVRAAYRLVDRLLRLFVAVSAAAGLLLAIVGLRRGDALALPALGLALWTGGFTFAHLLIHIEARYVMGLLGASAILLLWGGRALNLAPVWLNGTQPRTSLERGARGELKP
jgi:hypothetical protein